MKAITLWQPWATLVAIGAKRWETRSWAITYRGPLAIHAAAKWDPDVLEWLSGPFERAPHDVQLIRESLDDHGYRTFGDLPTGAVLAIVEATDCFPAEEVAAVFGRLHAPYELAAGDFRPGRFAKHLEHVRSFPHPIPARGRQGLWNWDASDCPRALQPQPGWIPRLPPRDGRITHHRGTESTEKSVGEKREKGEIGPSAG